MAGAVVALNVSAGTGPRQKLRHSKQYILGANDEMAAGISENGGG
jgi:hypothetical protein